MQTPLEGRDREHGWLAGLRQSTDYRPGLTPPAMVFLPPLRMFVSFFPPSSSLNFPFVSPLTRARLFRGPVSPWLFCLLFDLFPRCFLFCILPFLCAGIVGPAMIFVPPRRPLILLVLFYFYFLFLFVCLISRLPPSISPWTAGVATVF